MSQVREPEFDRTVALVLRIGAFSCFFVMLAGLISTDCSSPGPSPQRLSASACFSCLATPVVHVLVACILFFRENDRKYGAISLGVLVILLLGAVFGIGEH